MARHRRAASDWDELAGTTRDAPDGNRLLRTSIIILVSGILLSPAIALRFQAETSASPVNPPSVGYPPPISTSLPTPAATAPPVLRAPGQITVQVANGGTVALGATSTTAIVARLGYRTDPPVNATSRQPNTIVYFEPGYQPEASGLATALAGTLHVQPLVAPVTPTLPVVPPTGADLFVVLGTDAPL